MAARRGLLVHSATAVTAVTAAMAVMAIPRLPSANLPATAARAAMVAMHRTRPMPVMAAQVALAAPAELNRIHPEGLLTQHLLQRRLSR